MAIAETQVYMPQAPRPRLRLLEDERWLAFVLLVPTMVLLGMFIAYPFVRGILLSVTNSRVGVPGDFVGLANFYKIWNDGIFHTSVYNTFLYTGVTTVFKLALGLWLAMLLNRNFRGKAFTRAFILLPFIIPTVLSTFAWKWMFDPTFSVLNWLLYHLGLISGRINWPGDPDLAMLSIIVVTGWGSAQRMPSRSKTARTTRPRCARAARTRPRSCSARTTASSTAIRSRRSRRAFSSAWRVTSESTPPMPPSTVSSSGCAAPLRANRIRAPPPVCLCRPSCSSGVRPPTNTASAAMLRASAPATRCRACCRAPRRRWRC